MKPQGLLAKAPGAGFFHPTDVNEDNQQGQNLEDALQKKRDKLSQDLSKKAGSYVPRTGGT